MVFSLSPIFKATLAFFFAFSFPLLGKIALQKDHHISMIGAGMGSRMVHYGHFETEMQLRFPHHRLVIRNMCDEGNTPGFRPHPGRPEEEQFAFPGAKNLVPPRFLAQSAPAGFFENPDQWLTRLQTDIVLAFLGLILPFPDLKVWRHTRKNYPTLSITRFVSATTGNPNL